MWLHGYYYCLRWCLWSVTALLTAEAAPARRRALNKLGAPRGCAPSRNSGVAAFNESQKWCACAGDTSAEYFVLFLEVRWETRIQPTLTQILNL